MPPNKHSRHVTGIYSQALTHVLDLVGALLMKKAAVNALNKDSESPLHIAAAHAALPVLAVLLKASGTSLETAAQG